MILTPEILEQGKSARGGWCLNQFRALGIPLRPNVPSPYAGWKNKVLGKDFPESDIQQFLSNRAEKQPRKESTRRKLRNSQIPQVVSNCETPRKEKRERKNRYVVTNDFLQSYEWRKLRMEALKKHGARCQCCGASPATGAVMNVDHIKPRRIYPELALDIDNLQVLCSECNHGKGNWDMTDWRTEVIA